MTAAVVTIVVVPRERFSYTQKSLDSIYENTRIPFELIYVDGNSPDHVKEYLETQSTQKGFRLIRTEHYLAPNQARNLALPHVKTKYVALIDNDVLVTPGWLDTLVNSAEETGAWLVGPLILFGSEFNIVHMAGGTIDIQEKQGKNWMTQKRPYMHHPLDAVRDKIKPGYTDILELHCLLARTDVFTETGPFDEQFMSMCEEDDLSMTVANAGHKLYLEPDSVVSYVAPSPTDVNWSDLPYFFVRWSNAWCQTSVERAQSKWNLTEDSPFLGNTRYFVKIHRDFVNPRPKQQPLKFLVYALKRVFFFDIIKKRMDNKAARLLAQSETPA